jgi:hypothetical protein
MMVEHISYLTFYLMKIAHGSAGEIGVQWVGFFEADVEECPASVSLARLSGFHGRPHFV